MIIALVGKPGSGKSYFAKFFGERTRIDLIIVDDYIREHIYKMVNIKNPCKLSQFVYSSLEDRFTLECHSNNDVINSFKQRILTDIRVRTEFEDLLYNLVFEPVLFYYHNMKKDLIIDGILPRFVNGNSLIDIVLTPVASEDERERRLIQRGVSKARIQELQKLTEEVFNVF